MLEDVQYLGTFSSGVVKPRFKTADVTSKESTTDLPFIPSLVKRGENSQPTQCVPLVQAGCVPLVQANGTQGVMVFGKGH